MFRAPPWNSQLGRLVRLIEVPEKCGCDLRPVPCGCADPSACDCPRVLPICPCVGRAASALPPQAWATLLHGLFPDDYPAPPPAAQVDDGLKQKAMAALFHAFAPDDYAEPPEPPPAVALTKGARLALLRNRHGFADAEHPNGHLRLFRPGGELVREGGRVYRTDGDVTAFTVDRLVGDVHLRGEPGLREGGLTTARLGREERRRRLTELEGLVRPAYLLWPWHAAGAAWLPQAGRALAEIRAGKLYREKAATFAAYCEKTFDFQARDVAALFAAAGQPDPATPPGEEGTPWESSERPGP